MIEKLLPAEVASFATLGDDIPAWLFSDEAAQMQGAVDSRLREFTTTRTCARLAMAKLNFPMVPIRRGAWREPIWPAGIVGSITHCKGYRAAAVADQEYVLTMGIDAEPHEALPSGILEQVAVAQEQDWLSTAPLGIHWDRLLFSAKECIFKAWFPLARDWLDFNQAVVVFRPIECTFEARLIVPLLTPAGAAEFLTGRFLVKDGLLMTAIVVPR